MLAEIPTIIAIGCAKGGVGKTTIASNLTAAISRKFDFDLLMGMDNDPQGNWTDVELRDSDPAEFESASTLQVLSEERDILECVHEGWFIPATKSLKKISGMMSNDPLAVLDVRARLIDAAQYLRKKFIIIDCRNGLDYDVLAGIYSADIVLTPAQMDRHSLQGLEAMDEELDQIARHRERPVHLVVPVKNTAAELLELRKALKDSGYKATKTAIPNRQSLKKAHSRGVIGANELDRQIFDSLLTDILRSAPQRKAKAKPKAAAK